MCVCVEISIARIKQKSCLHRYYHPYNYFSSIHEIFKICHRLEPNNPLRSLEKINITWISVCAKMLLI